MKLVKTKSVLDVLAIHNQSVFLKFLFKKDEANLWSDVISFMPPSQKVLNSYSAKRAIGMNN